MHGFGNRFGIMEVVLDIFGRHQPGIVTKRCEFAAQVMCADAGFHADQARGYKRAIDAIKIIPEVGGAFLAGGPSAALTKAITASAAQFSVEIMAKGDKEEALKRSGLTYLLRLRAFHNMNPASEG